jgi:hypothetical protein
MLFIRIGTTFYQLERNGRAWRLRKLPDGKIIDVGRDEYGPTCDCESATYRPNREEVCKHVIAMREHGLV